MSSKTNRFSASDAKKTPIKFGVLGNLFKHTHSINLTSRFFAREYTAFLAVTQGRPICVSLESSNLEINKTTIIT